MFAARSDDAAKVTCDDEPTSLLVKVKFVKRVHERSAYTRKSV